MTRPLRDMTDAELYELRRQRQAELTRQPPSQADNPGAAPEKVPYADDWLGAFGSNALDSISFGWGDEGMGLLAGLGAALTGGDFGKAFEQQAEKSREEVRQHRFWNPEASMLGGLAGAFVPGGALGLGLKGAKFLQNLTPAQRIMAAAAGGGAAGGLYGAGAGDYDRLGGAAAGAGMGVVAGGALQGLGMGLGHAWRNLGRTAVPEERAAIEMGKAFQRTGTTREGVEAEVLRHREMGKLTGAEATMMDVLGDAGTDLVQAVGQRPSAGRVAMYNFMTARNRGLRERADKSLWENLGGGGRVNPANTVEDLEKIQKEQAAPLFAEVYKQRMNVRSTRHQNFYAKPFKDMERRNPELFDPARKRASASARRVLGPDAKDAEIEATPLYWHRYLENVSAEVGAHLRQAKLNPLGAARGSQVAEMTQDARAFNDLVRDMLGPTFRNAQDIYSGAAKAQDAVEFGVDVVRGSNDLALGTAAREIRRMTKGEREHARMGALSALSNALEKADSGTGRANALRGVIGNAAKRRTLTFLFDGEKGLERALKALDYEQELFENTTKSGIHVGPNTAEKMLGHNSVFSPNEIGGLSGMIRRALGREQKDMADEKLAASVLDLMRMPVSSADALRAAEAANRKGLLARALAEAERRRTFRQRMGPRAFTGGVLGALGPPNE